MAARRQTGRAGSASAGVPRAPAPGTRGPRPPAMAAAAPNFLASQLIISIKDNNLAIAAPQRSHNTHERGRGLAGGRRTDPLRLPGLLADTAMPTGTPTTIEMLALSE